MKESAVQEIITKWFKGSGYDVDPENEKNIGIPIIRLTLLQGRAQSIGLLKQKVIMKKETNNIPLILILA